MFTKQHYEAIAKKINDYYQRCPDFWQRPDDLLEHIAEDLADMFEADNPQFDRKRFLLACGMQEYYEASYEGTLR